MPSYLVEADVIRRNTYRVKAKNKTEAKEKVYDGEGELIAEGTWEDMGETDTMDAEKES